jgi:hypothetical protein
MVFRARGALLNQLKQIVCLLFHDTYSIPELLRVAQLIIAEVFLEFGIARNARPEAPVFVNQTIQVVTESGDQSEVLSAIRLVFVVVDVPDVGQGVFEVLLIHH